jgi:hypothetical protein
MTPNVRQLHRTSIVQVLCHIRVRCTPSALAAASVGLDAVSTRCPLRLARPFVRRARAPMQGFRIPAVHWPTSPCTHSLPMSRTLRACISREMGRVAMGRMGCLGAPFAPTQAQIALVLCGTHTLLLQHDRPSGALHCVLRCGRTLAKTRQAPDTCSIVIAAYMSQR